MSATSTVHICYYHLKKLFGGYNVHCFTIVLLFLCFYSNSTRFVLFKELSQHNRISRSDDLIYFEIVIQNAQFYWFIHLFCINQFITLFIFLPNLDYLDYNQWDFSRFQKIYYNILHLYYMHLANNDEGNKRKVFN